MLETYELRDGDFDRVMKFAGRGLGDNWVTPFDFFGDTLRLYQPKAGPCGLFAVLQAHIVSIHHSSPTLSNKDLLVEAVLRTMEKLRTSYTFCQLLDVENKHLVFLATQERSAAEQYLKESGLLQTEIAAKLIAVSLIYLAGPALLSSAAFCDPAVHEDQNTQMHFVLLLLTGFMADTCRDTSVVKNNMLLLGVHTKQDIGLLYMDTGNSMGEVGEHLMTASESIWVVYSGGHFFTIEWSASEFRIWDPFLDNDREYLVMIPEHPLYHTLSSLVKHDM